jgi:serine protease Do
MKTTLKSKLIIALLAAGSVALGWVATTQAQKSSGESKGQAAVTVNDAPLARDGRLASSYAPVIKRVSPTVVNVFTTKTVRNPFAQQWMPFFDDPNFRRFFGDPLGRPDSRRHPRTFQQRSLGSGVIVTPDGYIITNDHVVDGADEIKVAREKDRKEYTARIVGRDPKTDIAVLKVEADDLPHATFADSDKLEVGDVVFALGNPFGVGQTVTMGIVSAVGRGGLGIEDYEDFIQTDAAINPGNSGGALVDAEGRLVGINTAIVSRSGGNQGIGFAVPANLARAIMDRLVKDGKIVRGFLGVSIQDVTPELAKEFKVPESGGALISEVTEGSAAAAAGLKSGDVIIEFNGKPVKDSRTLRLTIGQTAPGTKADLKVLRDGKERSFKVTLKEMPGEKLAGGGDPTRETEDEALRGVGVSDLDANARKQFNVPEELKGAIIISVEPDSPSYAAGLREGDVILEINRKPVEDAEDAVRLTQNPTSKKTLVKVWSRGGTRFIVVDETKKLDKSK